MNSSSNVFPERSITCVIPFRLNNRQGALIELGLIHSPEHLAEFAQDL